MVGSVRTLSCSHSCSHSFCNCCVEEYLNSKKITFVDGFADVVCPTCRQRSRLPEMPSRSEMVISELMNGLHKTTLRYVCPFEGCDLTFLCNELEEHVMSCNARIEVCSVIDGCGGNVTRGKRHACLAECMGFVKEQMKELERKNRCLEECARKGKEKEEQPPP
jgi:hypothetical protein